MAKCVRILSMDGGGTREIVLGRVLVSVDRKLRKKTEDDYARLAHTLDGTRNAKSGEPRASAATRSNSVEGPWSNIEAYAFAEGRVIVNGRRVTGEEWRSGRAKEMFFYLLCSGMAKTRQQIAVDIWPDLPPAKSTSNFHISLYRARHALFPGIISVDEGRYKISDDTGIWFDVAEFSRGIDETYSAPIESARRAADLQTAVELYAGPFLSDVYSEWAEVWRRETEAKYVRALRKLVRWYCESGDLDKAFGLMNTLATLDPYNDDLLSDIGGWSASIETIQRLLNEFRRHVERLRNGDRYAPPQYVPNFVHAGQSKPQR